jgi:Ni/Fe-hydrogenase 1 B-type cytochrome subunit
MKRIYVWEFPVRLTHWTLAVCMVTLSFTGFYIGAPFIHAVDNSELIMAWMRAIHFTAAFVFVTAFALRMYWLFAGNKYARYNQIFPTSVQRWQDAYKTGRYYLFLSKSLPYAAGHTALAGLSYFALFLLYAIEIVTGSAMLYVAHGGGTIFWLMGGWSIGLISIAYLRLVHHIIMWAIAVFVVLHVYIGWHNDIVERSGLISSMFDGYKHQEEES